jgi:hypothetical protein
VATPIRASWSERTALGLTVIASVLNAPVVEIRCIRSTLPLCCTWCGNIPAASLSNSRVPNYFNHECDGGSLMFNTTLLILSAPYALLLECQCAFRQNGVALGDRVFTRPLDPAMSYWDITRYVPPSRSQISNRHGLSKRGKLRRLLRSYAIPSKSFREANNKFRIALALLKSSTPAILSIDSWLASSRRRHAAGEASRRCSTSGHPCYCIPIDGSAVETKVRRERMDPHRSKSISHAPAFFEIDA